MLHHLADGSVKPERVVVLGAGGFVGSAITRQLQSLDIKCLALGRNNLDLLADGAAQKLADQLRDTDQLVAVSAIAPVKNLEMLQANLVMIRHICEALKTQKVSHLINIGSDAVFADGPLPLTENSPKAPFSYHGLMHLAREVAFLELAIPMATLRPTLIYGVNDPHNGYGPNRFIRLAKAGEAMTLFGQGEERRDHVWVEDVARVVVLSLLHRSIGTLNVASGQVWSFREIASMVANMAERPVAIKGSKRVGEMPHGGYRPFDVAATQRAFPEFQYRQLPEGLAEVFADW